MTEHLRTVTMIAGAHVTVWWADLRQRVGGTGRAWTAVWLLAGMLVLLGVLSVGLAPEVGADSLRPRAVRAVLPVVFLVGAMVWTAFSLALPDTAAVETLLVAVPAEPVHRRIALAVVTLVPALLLSLCAGLVVAGGLITGAGSPVVAVVSALTVVAAAVAGMAMGALAGGGFFWLLTRARLLTVVTARGVSATAVVGLVAGGMAQVMGNVDRAPTLTRPLSLVGWAAVQLETHPVLALPLVSLALPLGLCAVLAGAAAGRPAAMHQPTLLNDLLGHRLHRSGASLTLTGLQARRLVRYQPNVGLLVMLATLTPAVVVVAGSRSPVFVSSAYFGLAPLASTSAVTVAGIERRASWLYLSTARQVAQLGSRLAAYLLGWGAFIVGLAAALVVTTPSFAWVDAISIWPILVMEMAIVLALGALLPISDEHSVGGVSGEFCAIGAILLLAVGLPRLEVLTSSTPRLVGTALVALVVALAVFGWRGSQRDLWRGHASTEAA